MYRHRSLWESLVIPKIERGISAVSNLLIKKETDFISLKVKI